MLFAAELGVGAGRLCQAALAPNAKTHLSANDPFLPDGSWVEFSRVGRGLLLLGISGLVWLRSF